MVICIASGKGGTGKTTFAVNLAYALAQRERTKPVSERTPVRLLDCDVEEPNDHLFVRPAMTGEEAVTVRKPVWDSARCTACGSCAEACRYNALAMVKGRVLVFKELCHSCGVCSFVCPEKALSERETVIGAVRVAPANEPFFFADGILNIGESLAPNVVRAVKQHVEPGAINLIDASPGTSCPVVEAVRDSDAVLLVTEPTPFGLNDLKLAVGLTLKLGVPTGIVVNRSDAEDAIIAGYARKIGIPIAGRIPFRRDYAEAYSEGRILVETFPELRENLLDIFDALAVARPPAPAEDVLALAPEESRAAFVPGTSEQYREITVISGKGGTGKTTVVGSLAHLARDKVLADNDVDAADLHLLLKPDVQESHDFIGGVKAKIDPERCVACRACANACRFGAVHEDGPGNGFADRTFRIDPLGCEGCGLCVRVCPAGAIRSEDHVTGRWYVSRTKVGPMVHARLGIAEENSGRLVARVRARAGELARTLRKEWILGDGPPGTGCPVIASVSGTDLVVVVTEPTVSGVHDLERVLKLTAHFCVPAAVIINKVDLNPGQARRIEELAAVHESSVIGRIPFDRAVNDALMAGKTVIECGESAAGQAIRESWDALENWKAGKKP